MSCTGKAILFRQYQEHVRLYVATVQKLRPHKSSSRRGVGSDVAIGRSGTPAR